MVLVLGVVLLLPSCSKKEEQASSLGQGDTNGILDYQDGDYDVVVRAYKKGMNVRVSFASNKITGVQVMDNNEDEPYLTDSLVIIDEILETQSAEVDAIAGATKTCKGIMKAVKQAQQEAISAQ